MLNKPDWVEKRRVTRRTAESILSNVRIASAEADPTEVLINELLIHKVELEIQMEELRRTNAELEETRDRYRDLYENALVGYLTITRSGMLSELNLTAAGVLGLDRQALGHRRFATLVAPEDRDRWSRLFLSIMEASGDGARAFPLQMQAADGSSLSVYIDCQRQAAAGTDPVMRLVLIDLRKFAPEVSASV